MTERAEHTPSPWSLDEKEPGELWISNVDRSYPVCMVTASGNVTERDKADARLIAAAPDLLAACQEFVRKVECGEAKSTRSYEQMKAAISRATGEA